MADSELDTAEAVTEALGGNAAVASLTGVTHKAVSNWRRTRNFPPKTYAVLTRALGERGLRAPARLWNMADAGAQT